MMSYPNLELLVAVVLFCVGTVLVWLCVRGLRGAARRGRITARVQAILRRDEQWEAFLKWYAAPHGNLAIDAAMPPNCLGLAGAVADMGARDARAACAQIVRDATRELHGHAVISAELVLLKISAIDAHAANQCICEDCHAACTWSVGALLCGNCLRQRYGELKSMIRESLPDESQLHSTGDDELIGITLPHSTSRAITIYARQWKLLRKRAE